MDDYAPTGRELHTLSRLARHHARAMLDMDGAREARCTAAILARYPHRCAMREGYYSMLLLYLDELRGIGRFRVPGH